MLRIERQPPLAHQQRHQRRETNGVKQHNGDQVLPPVHLLAANPRQPPDTALNAGKPRERNVVYHSRQQRTEWPRQHQQYQQEAGDK